jgi:hypothetical protein
MNRNTISASAQQQAQEAAAAHAQDLWKPISIWSQTKPASTVKSEHESAVHLSHMDLQLLQTSVASPTHKRGLIQVRFPSEAAPAASRMTQLPPERGRRRDTRQPQDSPSRQFPHDTLLWIIPALFWLCALAASTVGRYNLCEMANTCTMTSPIGQFEYSKLFGTAVGVKNTSAESGKPLDRRSPGSGGGARGL